VISGWEVGLIEGLQVEGKAAPVIPIKPAYGERGATRSPEKPSDLDVEKMLNVSDVRPAPAAADLCCLSRPERKSNRAGESSAGGKTRAPWGRAFDRSARSLYPYCECQYLLLNIRRHIRLRIRESDRGAVQGRKEADGKRVRRNAHRKFARPARSRDSNRGIIGRRDADSLDPDHATRCCWLLL